MNMESEGLELLRAIWVTPYGVSAQYFFVAGALCMFVLMIKRHKMTFFDAVLASIGLKPVLRRDILFNIVHFSTIVLPLFLLVLALQTVHSQSLGH